MIFKDRIEAGDKLSTLLPPVKNAVVVSLIRGGIIVGDRIAKKLTIKHLPLVVAKIPAPDNPELAIGAYCFGITYLIPAVVKTLGIDKPTIHEQILIAQAKFNNYVNRYGLKESLYDRLMNKAVIITDDGIATGASIKTALLYVKTKKPKKVYLAVPVAPADFNRQGFDKTFILITDPYFSAVSQYYKYFPPVGDEEVKKVLY